MAGRTPLDPPERRSRRSRRLAFAFGAALHGVALVALVYVTGLLSLIGDYRQELYVLPGVLLGGLLFPIAGDALRRIGRPALPLSLGIAAAVGLGLLWFNTADLVSEGFDLVGRSMFCAIGGLPLAVVTIPRAAADPTSRRSYLWAAGMGLGPIIMGLVYSVIYAEANFEGFAWIVLLNEIGALVLLLAALAWGRRRSHPRDEPSAPSPRSDPSEPAPTPSGEARSATLPAFPRALQGRRRARRTTVPLLVLSLALSVALLAPAPSTLRAGTPSIEDLRGAAAPPANRTPIQHLVLMMMENHAFDNLFGDYPSGGCAGSADPSLASELPAPLNLGNLSSASPYLPAPCTGPGTSALEELPNGTWSTEDPIEGYGPYHVDWDGGKMDGWLSGSGAQGLDYYTADQLAPEWDLAEEFSLADNYFASELTETLPNRLYSLTGYSPVINDYGPPPYVPYDQSIFGELDAYGLPWGYYLNDPSAGIGTLDSIEGMSASSPGLGTYSQFLQAASSGDLPAVSWVEPVDGGLGDQYDQEPPGNVLTGEMWMLDFVDALMESPEWGSTAILITYDEGGGYYDQVAPPTVDGELLGNRVPMVIISPYAKEAYVSHTEMNHASQLALVDYNWGLPALNEFVADSDLPLDMFAFEAPPRAPYPFTTSEGFPVPSAFPISPPAAPDLFPLYPMPLQLPLAGRPYSSYGSSATDLAQSGGPLFVGQDSPYTPPYLSMPVLSVLLLADVALWIAFPRLNGLWRPRRT
jgi:phospholipase C